MGTERRQSTDINRRVVALDWDAAVADLDNTGLAAIGPILNANECDRIAAFYERTELFRSTIDMARHRFGQGEYRYFANPLPDLVAALRASFWPHLLPIAREWAARLKRQAPWPDDFDAWLSQCHDSGQTRPTPLMLRYRPGDWNALHRDLYGDLVFPLQVVIGLDVPGVDYTGGEFVVVEQRPRAPSRVPRHKRSRKDTGLCSRREIARFDQPAVGLRHPCDTASARCIPANDSPWA